MNINLTLIAQLVSFAFFVWFTMKFVWPPLVQVHVHTFEIMSSVYIHIVEIFIWILMNANTC